MIRHELRMPHPSEVSRFVVWDLTNARHRIENAAGAEVSSGAGPRVSRGIEGMKHPSVEAFTRETPRGSGQVRTGTRVKARPAFLPLVFGDLGAEWEQVQSFFWSCLSPDRYAAWRVYRSDGTWRELMVTLDPSDDGYVMDPSQVRTIERLDLIADDPFWLGPEQVAATVAQASDALFFGPGGAPPFNIVSGSQDGSTGLTVAGDVKVWPVLTVQGPASAFRTAPLFETRSVEGAITVDASQKLVIDFDPRSQAALLRPKAADSGGSNVTAQLTGRAFYPIEPSFSSGVMVVLLSMVGAGQATLSYRPKYWRAV